MRLSSAGQAVAPRVGAWAVHRNQLFPVSRRFVGTPALENALD